MAVSSQQTDFAMWRRARPSAAVVLVVIVLLGAGLRLYRIEDQSVWADEWPNVAYLDAPDALTYVRLIQLMYPEQAQGCLYYFMQYWWAHAAGDSLFVLRLLPVLISLATIPLVYLPAALLYGRGAGLIAALCFALSPQHVWHAQEIRPYVLLTPLVCAALYGLLRGLRGDGRKWWAVNLIANAILPWVHLFALLAIGVQGLYLMLCAKARWRRALAWGAIQAILLIPFAWWMQRLPYTNEHPSLFHSVSGVLLDVVGDDVVSFHTDLLPPWKTMPRESLPERTRALLTVRPVCDCLLLAASCLAAFWLLRRTQARHRDGAQDAAPRVEYGNPALLLLLLLAVPGLALGALTFATQRPFLSPMYTMYNTIALYAAFGGMIAGLGRRRARIAGVTALAALYGYQLMVTLPEVTRTDWAAAAREIRAQGTAQDLVLEFEYLFPVACAEYYLEDNGLGFRRVPTLQAACEAAAGYFSGSPHDQAAKPRSVWLMYEQAFLTWLFPETDAATAVREALAPLGLECGERFFTGHRGLRLLRIQQGATSTKKDIGPVPLLGPVAFEDILGEMRARETLDGPDEARIAALRRVIAYWPPLNKCIFVTQAMDLIAAGEFDLAEGFTEVILERHPDFGLAHLALALARAGEGKDQAAREAVQRAFVLHPGLDSLIGPHFEAILGANGQTAAQLFMPEAGLAHTFLGAAMKAVYGARLSRAATEAEDL